MPGEDHNDVNLRAMCAPCHRLKSAHEGGIASARARSSITVNRAPEAHPGLIEPEERVMSEQHPSYPQDPATPAKLPGSEDDQQREDELGAPVPRPDEERELDDTELDVGDYHEP